MRLFINANGVGMSGVEQRAVRIKPFSWKNVYSAAITLKNRLSNQIIGLK